MSCTRRPGPPGAVTWTRTADCVAETVYCATATSSPPRGAGLLPDGGADDLAVAIDAVLPADVDRLRRLSTTTAWLKAGLRWSPGGLRCRVLMCCLL